MWLSKQAAQTPDAQPQPGVGVVSMAAGDVAAVSDAEYRSLQLLAPGGFAWRPRVSDKVLIFKGTALGTLVGSEPVLQPGECCLFANGCSVQLKNDGSIHIQGAVYVNGVQVHADGE